MGVAGSGVFGNGACHILAGVYLQAPPLPGFHAERIIPGDGFAGNHIYVTDGTVAFDYHGYTLRNRLLRYYTNTGRANMPKAGIADWSRWILTC
ncbi:hypothetical protein [Falsiruegeria mediterranea]|uniref:Uncharacterized protein n=1 Tax=Falsiruegeria mediterranea M17 TaxID=1200281 RepID=A0A2R8CEC3_9RHOB|nr:hypothetical protein [Falsiruegeria mediterranea]SPJ30776.1 hypothetical protein TRM7615_04310 [Falsiruegeria mediterranea M17]